MSEDTYATVDKSKKIKYRKDPSYTFSSGPVMDIYAQVDKSKKSFMKQNNTPDQDHYDAIPTGSIYCNTVDVSAAKIDVLYDSASSPTYSQLIKNQGLQSTTGTVCEIQRKYDNKKEAIRPIHCNMCLLFWLFALITLILACAAAIIIAFLLVSGLRSDVNMIIMSRSSYFTITAKLVKLQMNLQVFTDETKKRVADLRHNITIKSSNAVNLAIDLKRIHDRLVFNQPDIMNMINENASNLTNLIDNTFLNISTQITELNIYIKFNKSRNIHDTIDTSIQYITNIIQENYVFESCISINTFTLPFSSGEYLIQTLDNVSRRNCTIYSCDGQTGGWRRVVYLNVSDSSASSCPGQLETVDSSSPLSCRNRHNIYDGGCASVMYPINNDYKCLFGRVSGYFKGSPDGFQKYGNARPSTPSTNVNTNYVDGVILTYGSPMKHMWTYAAALGSDYGCTSPSVIPSFLSDSAQYTCEVCINYQVCGNSLLWIGGELIGSSVFFRELPELTSDDITVRVCRDESRYNEDILITLVEIFAKRSR